MDLTTAMGRLESAGSEQTRKTYARHGVTGPMFGVLYSALGKLVREIGTDHDLALALWGTGNHDARVLGTMIADRDRIDAALVERWGRALDSYPLVGAVAKAAGTALIPTADIDRWCDDPGEWMSSLGWAITAVATQRADLPDSYFKGKLEQIRREIHGRPNWTRYEMNNALIAIGVRSERLRNLAMAAARQIGRVDVDHGPTACKTPDAAEYIEKVMARRAKKAGTENGKKTKPGAGKERSKVNAAKTGGARAGRAGSGPAKKVTKKSAKKKARRRSSR